MGRLKNFFKEINFAKPQKKQFWLLRSIEEFTRKLPELYSSNYFLKSFKGFFGRNSEILIRDIKYIFIFKIALQILFLHYNKIK